MMAEATQERDKTLYSRCPNCDGEGVIEYGEINEFSRPCLMCDGNGYFPSGLTEPQVQMYIKRAEEAYARRGIQVRGFERLMKIAKYWRRMAHWHSGYREKWLSAFRAYVRVRDIAMYWRKKTEEFDSALIGEGITNLEILEGSLQEHRKLIAQNGQVLYVEDPNASLYLIGELEEMTERLRQTRVSLLP